MLGGLALAGDGVPTSRPARALKGSSSSFVRSWDGLPLSQVQMRGLGDANVGRDTIFGFQTIGKTLVMSEIAKGKDALARVIFASFPTCVDANQHTASGSQIDVLVGFATGDIIWLDPLTARYSRYNKSGCITSSPVTSILWLPPAPPTSPTSPAGDNGLTSPRSNLFVTSHADGSIVLWDKDKEDWNGFLAQPFPAPASVANTPGLGGGGFARGSEWSSSSEGGATRGEGGGGKVAAGQEDMVVSRPPTTADRKGQSTAKFNPVAHWRLSKKAITAFAFSPDLTLCAAVGDDGCLRIIDAVEEKLLDVFSSYFGALNCVAWSPDGRFVVTGGQDDLCTVYAPLEQHVVAHCQGHASWVKGVAWDAWRSEDRTLRFASVGEDCKLVLWDLSSASLTRPKAHAHPHVRRHSTSSQTSLHRRSISESGPHLPLDPSERAGPAFHPAPRRDDVSLLQPIMVKTLSTDLFSDVHILPEYLILGTRVGQVRQYDRPPTGDGSLTGLSSEFAASVVRIDARAR
ncbi:WD40-repeat-containing domain protein [Rhodotorula diobovata]|uniref:WD40-repeat-containing domain protein n=1 Tax=Rhodotorula diobovata TaxID=5288 RepID=A0A5C5FV59_9BASI|nr:WD40-repeat-containing domain protein [Rhodotorula diobovata]